MHYFTRCLLSVHMDLNIPLPTLAFTLQSRTCNKPSGVHDFLGLLANLGGPLRDGDGREAAAALERLLANRRELRQAAILLDKGDRLAPIVAPPLRKRKIASSKVEDPPSIKRMTRSQCAAEAEHSSQIYCQVNTSTPPTIRRSAGIVGPFRSSYLRPLAFPGPPNSNGVSRTLFSFSPLRPQSAGVYTA